MGQMVSYTYDLAGQLTGVDFMSGPAFEFTYDAAHRLTGMTDESGTTAWTYDYGGNVASKTQVHGSSFTRDVAYAYLNGQRGEIGD
ncbi:MAG: RHS repeat protein [Thiobacillus sp.]|nr:RHS repeat protein [Thiobacillus sp.]